MDLAPRKRSLLVCTLLALAATHAVADPGVDAQRYRVTFQPDRVATGSLVASDASTISLRTDNDGIVQIDRSRILSADRLSGQRRNWGIGIFAGAAAGALVGGLVSADDGGDEWVSDGFVVMYYSIIGTVAGAAVGAFITSDTWESVPVSALSVDAGRGPNGGAAVFLSFRF